MMEARVGLRRILRALVLLLPAALGLVSCSSLRLELRARDQGVPVWVLKQEKQKGRVFFVGKGSDSDSYMARLKATGDIADQIASRLGARLSDARARSLATTGKIEDYGLFIQDESQKRLEDGTFVVHLLASASEKKLDAGRSEAAAALHRLAAEVRMKEDEAKDRLQEDRDIDAVKAYLEAASAALEIPDGKSEADDCLKKACAILKRIEITLASADPALAQTQVHVQRRNRVFSSAVAGATVRASFQAEGLDGAVYDDSYVFGTDTGGRFSFVPPNDGLVKKGRVLFGIDLGQALERYEKVASPEDAERIAALLAERTVPMDYDLVSPCAGSLVLVGITEYDIHGDPISPSDAPSATAWKLASLLRRDDIRAVPFCPGEGGAAEVGMACDYLVIGQIGVEEDYDTEPAVSLLANGVFDLYRKGSAAPVFSSGAVRTSASGSENEAVLREAFDRFAETARFQLRDVFFDF